MKPLSDNVLVWFVASVSLVVACASNPKPVATKAEPVAPETVTSVEKLPVAIPVDDCASETLSGRWLIHSGTARMKCADGRETSITAGGSVELGKDGDRLKMLDGSCEYLFARNACEFSAPTGGTCKHDDTVYDVREVSLKRKSPGVLRMVYTLSHKDDKGVSCTDSTEAELVVRASRGREPSGLWKSEVMATGKPGHVELKIEGGRCAIQSPDFSGEGACTVKGDQLLFQSDASPSSTWGGACGTHEGRYAFSIADGCAGLVLESTQDACDARLHAVDFLFLHRVR